MGPPQRVAADEVEGLVGRDRAAPLAGPQQRPAQRQEHEREQVTTAIVRAHTQEAAYLDSVSHEGDWSPYHYAYHLTRRVRGLPFWFSLATYGTRNYTDAIETVLALTRATADEIRRREQLELALDPEISVVVFRRPGWSDEDYTTWCEHLLQEQIAFVLPTTWKGEKLMRFCFVNPNTTIEEVRQVLDTIS